jgi:hypothetical protein
MLRLQTPTGFYLITHPDHAHLAGAFAAHWGNDLFPKPQPHLSVLHAIHAHDDGWAARDANPTITRHGKPSAFSAELVGKYSAFEEIDLADYLGVRERALAEIEATDPYAALLISMHTLNLLTDRADRTTITPAQLPLLDAFLDRQRALQHRLIAAVRQDPAYTAQEVCDQTLLNNFHLLQACDNLSLLACVAWTEPANLLHALPTQNAAQTPIEVHPTAPRQFRLTPWPFDRPSLTCTLPARHVEGHTFESSAALAALYAAAPTECLDVHLVS